MASDIRAEWLKRSGKAGAFAALVMIAAQFLLRLTVGSGGVPSFPEMVVAMIARLTPVSVFGWVTETFGSLGQNLLFIAVTLAIVGIGWLAGRETGKRVTQQFAKLPAALITAAVLLVIAGLVVAPLGRFGIFGLESGHALSLFFQLVVTFLLWAVVWSGVVGEPVKAEIAAEADTAAVPAETVSRRAFIDTRLASGASLALLLATGWMAQRLIRTPKTSDVAQDVQRAEEIVATAEAEASTTGAAATPIAAADLPSFDELERAGVLTPRLTPTVDFYHVSKNIADPIVAADGWTLTIDGLVERPLTLTLADLQARPQVQRITTLGCISNELNGDLISTGEWSGVPLAALLEEVGPKAGVVDLRFEAADDYEDSIPLAQAMDPDNLLVLGLNGAPLTDDHGFPARLIVPAIYGMKNVKWIRRIELVDVDVKGYWQSRGWSDPAPYQIWGRIDTPASGESSALGEIVAAGMAFAGDRGVSRVECSIDEGGTWWDATLEAPLNPPFTWVRWETGFTATDDVELWIRVTDGEGTIAPQEENPPLPDGATGWPARKIKIG